MAREVDPREVGGTYLNAYWGMNYTVLSITRDPISFTTWYHVEWDNGQQVTHCTPWSKKDLIIKAPTHPTRVRAYTHT